MKNGIFLFLAAALLSSFALLFLAQKTLPADVLKTALLEAEETDVIGSLSGAVEKAGRRAREIIGEAVPLRVSVNPSGARAIFSCRNGYVLADLKTGETLEFSLSLPTCAGRGDAGEAACVEAARAFLGTEARGEPALEEDAPGFLRVRFGETVLVVKRDTGRVVMYVSKGG